MDLRQTSVVVALLLVSSAAMPVQAKSPPRSNPGREATDLHKVAESQFLAKHWAQGQIILEQFVKDFPTHEHVPVAYLQLAHCCLKQNNTAGYEKALDFVIRNYGGSAEWFSAYGSKLKQARLGGDRDKYLAVLKSLLRQSKILPLDLSDEIGRSFKKYFGEEYYYNSNVLPVHPDLAVPPVAPKRGYSPWVLDIVWAGDTPERAGAALRLIGSTLREHLNGLPPVWQFAHAALMRKAGQATRAETMFRQYLGEYDRDDPRGAELWLHRIRAALAANDANAVDQGYDRLVSNYAGYGSVSAPLLQRLHQLCSESRYDRFVRLAGHYRKHHATMDSWSDVVKLWVRLARRSADQTRTAEALKAVESMKTAGEPRLNRKKLLWHIDLNLDLGKTAQAVKLSAELIGPKMWSAGSFKILRGYADDHAGFQSVVKAAREKWNVPDFDPDPEAAKLLEQLRRRLGDDQDRHADEIGDEMFAKHRKNASTIQATKLLADYFYKKLRPKERDKWIDRMVAAYPHHPFTEDALFDRMTAERAAKHYDKLAEAIETALANFPGCALRNDWYVCRIECFKAKNDLAGEVEFARQYLTAAAIGGEPNGVRMLFNSESDFYRDDPKGHAGAHERFAASVAGTPVEVNRLYRAWHLYYYGGVHPWSRLNTVDWDKGMAMTRALQNLKSDGEVRWKMAYADINLLAHQGKGKQLLKELTKRLKTPGNGRDLSLRLNFHKVGQALGADGKAKDARQLAKKLRKLCRTRRDTIAIDMLLGGALYGAAEYEKAGEKYLDILYQHYRRPGLRYDLFMAAMQSLAKAESSKHASESDRYIKKIASVQVLAPAVMYYQAKSSRYGNPGRTVKVYRKLVRRYPASGARDRLGTIIREMGQKE